MKKLSKYGWLFIFTVVFVSCGKYKVTSESLIGNWTFTKFTTYVQDTNQTYIVTEVNENGFVKFEKDSSVVYDAKGVLVGNAKLPFVINVDPLSVNYNNGNPFLLETNFIAPKANLELKKKGNQKNYFQSYFDVGTTDYSFELLQLSKKKIRLKIALFKSNSLDAVGFTLIELTK